MALHNTQCPHCFTTYVISDEQYRASDGMVRCGTCRERFQARFITGKEETPRFDPRQAFIEPLTEEETPQGPSLIEQANAEPEEFDFADPHTESEKISLASGNVHASVNSSMSLDIDDDAPVTPLDSSKLSADEMLANIKAKQEREREEEEARLAAQQQLDLSLPELQADTPTEDSIEAMSQEPDDGQLIDQVDSLVDDKLLKPTDSEPLAGIEPAADIEPVEVILLEPEDEPPTPDPDNAETEATPELIFDLDKRPRRKRGHWLLVPPLLIIAIVLAAALWYQLWLKQILNHDVSIETQQNITKLSAPLVSKLEGQGIELPVRRNLSQLELLNARTEPHPNRSSTILLRVSLINHAEIAQPLPWLEMSLTDADGRLVSRRNLAPEDYIYNNDTQAMIGPRELKKTTIELLSFPKQATGYELKLLNR